MQLDLAILNIGKDFWVEFYLEYYQFNVYDFIMNFEQAFWARLSFEYAYLIYCLHLKKKYMYIYIYIYIYIYSGHGFKSHSGQLSIATS